MITKIITVSGKRKRAVAKASIKAGKGRITINKMPYENLDFFKKLAIQEPMELTKQTLGNFDFDIDVVLNSGGSESRIEAARLAIARAILEFTKSDELKKAFAKYDKNMLVADTRRKEPYKPGDSKARAKRQKSFR
jgi:small subunit ribosomal protein S9